MSTKKNWKLQKMIFEELMHEHFKIKESNLQYKF